MSNNYEWQRQYTKQRIQSRVQEAQLHHDSKQQIDHKPNSREFSIVRLPLQLVTAILGIFR